MRKIYKPQPPSTEVELFYYNPTTLARLSDEAQITWAELMNNGTLSNDEFELFIKLSEPADLSMPEVILIYLHFWEGKTEPELAEMYGIRHQRISEMITEGKNKLYPYLKIAIKRNKKLARVLQNSADSTK